MGPNQHQGRPTTTSRTGSSILEMTGRASRLDVIGMKASCQHRLRLYVAIGKALL